MQRATFTTESDMARADHAEQKPLDCSTTAWFKRQGPVVLIGTRRSLPLIAAQLRLIEGGPRPSGWIAVEDLGDVRPPYIGGLSHLSSLHRLLSFGGAIVCIPAADGPALSRVQAQLAELDIEARIVPPLEEVLLPPAKGNVAGQVSHAGHGSISLAGKAIDVAELIGRTPYGIDRRTVSRILTDKRVLITGAGGSIGSEISRIVATFRPSQIVLMERSENALFEIDRQIARRFPDLSRKALLHDVTDHDLTREKLAALKPHTVFHAAAHKHVPLMEDHPAHAVANNFFGTKSIADAAMNCGTERFVLISSDKAVNPSSVMGATKRLAEMYLQGLQRGGEGVAPATTQFSIVRFGNVLGSACSVLPIWSSQIAEGGPITVTDRRMTRYFMTIHEAAALVIQAAAIENPVASASQPNVAPLYVLDMGEPISILELARRFVLASGVVPRIVGETPIQSDTSESIEIQISGIRPGEKLHEELAYAAEHLNPTRCPGINTWAGGAYAGPSPLLLASELLSARTTQDRESVVNLLKSLVPEMRDAATLAKAEQISGTLSSGRFAA